MKKYRKIIDNKKETVYNQDNKTREIHLLYNLQR